MGRRSPKGEGSVYQRSDGRWCASVIDHDGKRRYHYAKTERQARKTLRDDLRALEKNESIPGYQLTLEEHVKEWLEFKRTGAGRVRPRTWQTYKRLLETHVLPKRLGKGRFATTELGKQKIARITTEVIEDLYGQLSADGLSPGSVHNVHMVLSGAMKWAVKKNRAGRNPTLFADRPKVMRRDQPVLNAEQLNTFFGLIEGHRLEAAMLLAATTGKRVWVPSFGSTLGTAETRVRR